MDTLRPTKLDAAPGDTASITASADEQDAPETAPSVSPGNGLLLGALAQLEGAGIDYCVLRDGHLLAAVTGGSEVDMLVRTSQLAQTAQLFAKLGFVRLRRWGYAPHQFFVGYDEEADAWIKIDVVTEIAFGRPVHAMTTPLAERCLKNRHRAALTYVPTAEDELVMLLLHGIIDKRAFPAARRERIKDLCRQITATAMAPLLARYWVESISWERLCRLIERDGWDELCRQRAALCRRLTRGDVPGVLWRELRDRTLRRLSRWQRTAFPQALSVALLAPDGSGKSTLARGIVENFFFPTRLVYMGLYQQRSRRSHLPGLGLIGKLLTQWRRFLLGVYHRACGRLVIFDRYTYDALLPPRRPLGRAGRWRRWILAHACPAPDLVLILDAPGAVLFARKGEHDAAELERQRQGYRQLRDRGLPASIIDATRDPQRVRREVISTIWRGYARRDIHVRTK